ncbi:transcription factor, contains a PHD finger motif [Tilletia horrida]|nr:transcription factor, contains a PHD finger motif [Tilletia horrida]
MEGLADAAAAAAASMAEEAVDAARKKYIAKTAPHLLPHHHHSGPSSSSYSPSPSHRDSSPGGSEEGGDGSPNGRLHHGLQALGHDPLQQVARVPTLQHAPGSRDLFTTPNAPNNRAMWRYTAAGPDQAHLPRILFREVPMAPLGVHWDWIDRSPYTKISIDANVISTDRGWRSGRANVGVRWGAWYYEVDYLEPEHLSHAASAAAALAPGVVGAAGRSASPSIGSVTGTASPRPHVGSSSSNSFHTAQASASGSATPHVVGSASTQSSHNVNTPPVVLAPAPIGALPAPMKDGPHLRIGWARREANLNAPAGFDGYSYALRDSTGQKCYLSRMAPYAEQGFVPGDTVGIYIYIPPPAYIQQKLRRRTERQNAEPLTRADGDVHSQSVQNALPPRERQIRRKRVPIRYKGQLYFESLEYNQSKEMDHLMERSRHGQQKTLPADEGQPDIIGIDCPLSNEPSVVAAWEKTQAEKKAAAAAAQQKKRRLPGQPAPNPNANLNLRPLPVLKGSFIGFSINGRWQGVAFRDLLDFRPLPPRRRNEVKKNYNSKEKASNAKQVAAKKGSGRSTPAPRHEDAYISTDSSDTTSDSDAYSSDSSAGNKGKGKAGNGHHSQHHRRSPSPEAGKSTTDRILKMRQNLRDDGETGYFPFVSVFGGARARINAGPHFKHAFDTEEVARDVAIRNVLSDTERSNIPSTAPDPANDEKSLLSAMGLESNNPGLTQEPSRIAWRAMIDRYEEYYAEQFAYDLADERRLARRLHRRHGRRRRGEFDPYELLRHSGDGTGAKGGSALDAGGIVGALNAGTPLGEGGSANGLPGTSFGADFLNVHDGQDRAGSAGPEGATPVSKPDPRSKAGRRESGRTARKLPLLRKKKKSKKDKQAAAMKALETKRRKREEGEAAALLAVGEADAYGENADEEDDDEDEERRSASEGEDEDEEDEDDVDEDIGGDRKKARLSAAIVLTSERDQGPIPSTEALHDEGQAEAEDAAMQE